MKTRMIVLGIFMIFLFQCLTVEGGAIAKPRLTARPGIFRGQCPATIAFQAEILPPPLPGPVRYKFVRSDGGQSGVETIHFTRLRKQTVTTTWTLNTNYKGWMKLVIVFPGHVESNPAHFQVICRGMNDAGAETGTDDHAPPQAEPVPARFFIDFPDACLVYVPASRSMQVAAGNRVLSYGDGWESCELKPYLYHLRRRDWRGFFWQVNTSRREVIRIRNGDFCRISEGARERLNATVDVVGGGGDTRPARFFIRFRDSYLVYEPRTDLFQIIASSIVLSRGSDWEKCRVKPYLYHLRQRNWQGFFWQVNTSRREVWRVENGNFCRVGGVKRNMAYGVRIVD